MQLSPDLTQSFGNSGVRVEILVRETFPLVHVDSSLDPIIASITRYKTLSLAGTVRASSRLLSRVYLEIRSSLILIITKSVHIYN